GVEFVAVDRFENRRRRSGRLDAVALALQQQPKGLEHVRLIVRNQHARRDGFSDHRRLLFNWPSLRNCHKELPQSSVASHKSSVTSRQSQIVSQKSSVTSRQSRVV